MKNSVSGVVSGIRIKKKGINKIESGEKSIKSFPLIALFAFFILQLFRNTYCLHRDIETCYPINREYRI